MIILPERGASRTRILLPVPEREWREPSQAQPKDMFGNQNRTTFYIIGGRNGRREWVGRFEDRDDADYFLWAIATGILEIDRALWRLPTPNWCPDIGEGLIYELITYQSLTSPTGSDQTWTSQSDWNNSSNEVNVLGSGASGGAAIDSSSGAFRSACGGGGSSWSQILNFSVAVPGTTTKNYRIAAAAAAQTATGSAANAGNNGNPSYFDGTALGSASVSAEGGTGGGASTSGNSNGGAGGTTAASIGTNKNAGGRGGNYTGGGGVPMAAATGGGGCAGPSGVGAQGADKATQTTAATSGGTGNGGNTAAGANGTTWATTPSSGPGGGGTGAAANGSASTASGGGTYGAGGGAATSYNTGGTVTSGAGTQGLIVLIYTPVKAISRPLPRVRFYTRRF